MVKALMKKLQKEGGYKELEDEIYRKTINSTTIYELIPQEVKAKFKLGQHLDQKRFEMIIKHLEKRGKQKDIETVKLMKRFYG